MKCPEVRWTRRCGSAPAAAPWRCQRPGRVRSGSLHAARTQRRSLRRPPAARSPVRSSVPASAVPAAAACAPRRGERTRRPDSTGGGRGRPGGGLRFHRSIWVLRPPPPAPREAPPAAPTTPSPPGARGSVRGALARLRASARGRSASPRVDRDAGTERRPGEGPQHSSS